MVLRDILVNLWNFIHFNRMQFSLVSLPWYIMSMCSLFYLLTENIHTYIFAYLHT